MDEQFHGEQLMIKNKVKGWNVGSLVEDKGWNVGSLVEDISSIIDFLGNLLAILTFTSELTGLKIFEAARVVY